MKRLILSVLLVVFSAVLGVAIASATGDADEPTDNSADVVFLGDLDLAERLEIWRNQYRRMTPGDAPLVQDVGIWPAAWEEFSSVWDTAPAERDLATWLVPFYADRMCTATVLRDANGTALWSGATDFAKDGSANVTLTGALVDELDWPLYTAAQDEIARRFEAMAPQGNRGGPYTNGLRFTNVWVATNGDYHFDFGWDSNGEVQVFCRAMHTTSWVETVVYTNDENQVVTNDFSHWRELDKFKGRPDAWEVLGVLTVTNGGGSFTDTNLVPDYDKVRFYTAAKYADSDGNGITDGEEWAWGITSTTTDSDNDGLTDYQERKDYRTDPDNPDTDGDGWSDGEEVLAGTDPRNRLDAPRLARGVLIHAVKYAVDSSNQWVQLHCSGPRSVDVGGFLVQAAGTNWETVATLPEGTWMEPGHFLLVGGEGVTNADLTAGLDLAGSYPEQPTAGVRLMAPEDPTNAPVDILFYGTHIPFNAQGLDTAGWLSETTNLWASATRHLERWSLGLDTDREDDWRHIEDGAIYNAWNILDSDGDNLTDQEEYESGYNPLNPDMDNDGLLDGFEVEQGLVPTDSDSDDDGTPDGEEESPLGGQSYVALQEARDVSVHVVYPAGWSQGDDLGLNGIVSFQVEDTGGFAFLGAIWECGAVAEDYEVDVNGAASFAMRSSALPNGHKVVKLFVVPNGTNAVYVTVTDGGPNPNVTTPEELGADIRAAFRRMKLDVELAGVGEEAEIDPGVYVGNSEVYYLTNTPCRLRVTPRAPQWLPGVLHLLWDTNDVSFYDAEWSRLSSLSIPLGGFAETNLIMRGISPTESDVFFRWQSSTNGQDVAHVVCYEANVAFSDNTPCDGEEVFVTLEIIPQRVDAMFQDAVWTIEASGRGDTFDNPCGCGIELLPVANNPKQWRIPNARWFVPWGYPCDNTAYYELSAQCDFGAFSCNTKGGELAVSAFDPCFGGGFSANTYWAGTLVFNTHQNTNREWVATVSPGTFHREIVGTISITAPTNSQFYPMVLAEESAHAQQYGNPGSSYLSDLWIAQNVISEVLDQGGFVSTNAEAARKLAIDAFNEARIAEENRSFSIESNRTCELEREAKQIAGADYWVSLECTYPDCSP